MINKQCKLVSAKLRYEHEMMFNIDMEHIWVSFWEVFLGSHSPTSRL